MDEYKIRFTNDIFDFKLEKSYNSFMQDQFDLKEEEIIQKILSIINDDTEVMKINVLNKLPSKDGTAEGISFLDNILDLYGQYELRGSQARYNEEKKLFFEEVKKSMFSKVQTSAVPSISGTPECTPETENLDAITSAPSYQAWIDISLILKNLEPVEGDTSASPGLSLDYSYTPVDSAGTNTEINNLYKNIKDLLVDGSRITDKSYPELYLFVFLYLHQILSKNAAPPSSAEQKILQTQFDNLKNLMVLIKEYTELLKDLYTIETNQNKYIIVKHQNQLDDIKKNIYVQEKKIKNLTSKDSKVCKIIQDLQIVYRSDRFLEFKPDDTALNINYYYEIKNYSSTLDFGKGFYLSMDVDLSNLNIDDLQRFTQLVSNKLSLFTLDNIIDIYLKFDEKTSLVLVLLEKNITKEFTPLITPDKIKDIKKIEVLKHPNGENFTLHSRIQLNEEESTLLEEIESSDFNSASHTLGSDIGKIGINFNSDSIVQSYFPGRILRFTFKDSIGYQESPIDKMQIDALEQTRDQLYQEIENLKRRLEGKIADSPTFSSEFTEKQLEKVYQYNQLSQEYKDLMHQKDKILKQNSQHEIILRSSQNLKKKIKFYHSQIKTIKVITLITHIILAVIIIVAIIYRKLAK